MRFHCRVVYLFIFVSKRDALSSQPPKHHLLTPSGQGVFPVSPGRPAWQQRRKCWGVHCWWVTAHRGWALTDGLTAFCSDLGVTVQSLCSLLASENFIIKDGLCTCPKSILVLLVFWPQCFTVDFLLFQCLVSVIHHADGLIELQAWQMVLECPLPHDAKEL